MLRTLHVQNLAIINLIDIEFKDGLTAITGETGAGKSLIIDAIGLLTGARSSSSLVRQGEAKAVIEGTFDNVNENTLNVLKECGIDDEGLLILRRDIYANGKSVFRVNGLAVSLVQAEQICDSLIDIHTQNDSLRLFDKKNYLSFIDDSRSKKILNDYLEQYNVYQKKLKDYFDLTKKNDELIKNFDYLNYQLNELETAKLSVNEEENIEEEIRIISNYETLFSLLQNLNEIINQSNLRDNLHEIINILKKLSTINSKYSDYLNSINDAYYSIDDLESTASSDLFNLEYDENHLNNLHERLSEINRLKKKYHQSVGELIEYKEELKKQIDASENYEFYLSEALKEVNNSYELLVDLAKKLTKQRKTNVKELQENIITNLKELMLEKVQISFEFNEPKYKDSLDSTPFHNNGVDDIDILISFNPGEPLKPLSKVASGGEMSRVMLSLKANLFKNRGLSTVIFDEIDTGMSGTVAGEVAKKLKEMSKEFQVFSITHLPIIAGIADQQLFVSKDVQNDLTFTSIHELSYEERLDVLSEMISPNDTSGKAREVAVELIENSKK